MEVGWLTGCLGGRLVEKSRVSPGPAGFHLPGLGGSAKPLVPTILLPSSVQKCQYLGEVGFPVSRVPSG